jgi:hypothetical protein
MSCVSSRGFASILHRRPLKTVAVPAVDLIAAVDSVNAGANSVAVIPLRGEDSYKAAALIPTAYEPHDILSVLAEARIYPSGLKATPRPPPACLSRRTISGACAERLAVNLPCQQRDPEQQPRCRQDRYPH